MRCPDWREGGEKAEGKYALTHSPGAMQPSRSTEPQAENGREPFNRICSTEMCVGGCVAVRETTVWLEKRGISEYAQRFAENRIDFSVLRDLRRRAISGAACTRRRGATLSISRGWGGTRCEARLCEH